MVFIGNYSEMISIGYLIKKVGTAPERPADGMVGCIYESFVPGKDCCELGRRRRYSLRGTFALGGMQIPLNLV